MRRGKEKTEADFHWTTCDIFICLSGLTHIISLGEGKMTFSLLSCFIRLSMKCAQLKDHSRSFFVCLFFRGREGFVLFQNLGQHICCMWKQNILPNSGRLCPTHTVITSSDSRQHLEKGFQRAYCSWAPTLKLPTPTATWSTPRPPPQRQFTQNWKSRAAFQISQTKGR